MPDSNGIEFPSPNGFDVPDWECHPPVAEEESP